MQRRASIIYPCSHLRPSRESAPDWLRSRWSRPRRSVLVDTHAMDPDPTAAILIIQESDPKILCRYIPESDRDRTSIMLKACVLCRNFFFCIQYKWLHHVLKFFKDLWSVTVTTEHQGQIYPLRSFTSINLPKTVFRIRNHMFLGLPDSDLDPLVRGMDPDPAPDPSIIMQK